METLHVGLVAENGQEKIFYEDHMTFWHVCQLNQIIGIDTWFQLQHV